MSKSFRYGFKFLKMVLKVIDLHFINTRIKQRKFIKNTSQHKRLFSHLGSIDNNFCLFVLENFRYVLLPIFVCCGFFKKKIRFSKHLHLLFSFVTEKYLWKFLLLNPFWNLKQWMWMHFVYNLCLNFCELRHSFKYSYC